MRIPYKPQNSYKSTEIMFVATLVLMLLLQLPVLKTYSIYNEVSSIYSMGDDTGVAETRALFTVIPCGSVLAEQYTLNSILHKYSTIASMDSETVRLDVSERSQDILNDYTESFSLHTVYSSLMLDIVRLPELSVELDYDEYVVEYKSIISDISLYSKVLVVRAIFTCVVFIAFIYIWTQKMFNKASSRI